MLLFLINKQIKTSLVTFDFRLNNISSLNFPIFPGGSLKMVANTGRDQQAIFLGIGNPDPFR